jgi:hypothetical protein
MLRQFSMRQRVIGFFMLAIFGVQAFLVSTLWADDAIQKKPVATSADQRFLDYGDGTILDKKSNLMWMKLDYWLIEKKWVNWYTAMEFAQRMNNKNFAGYEDWRLPTPEEAKMLYAFSQKAAAGAPGPVPKKADRPSSFPIRTKVVRLIRIKSTAPTRFSDWYADPSPEFSDFLDCY